MPMQVKCCCKCEVLLHNTNAIAITTALLVVVVFVVIVAIVVVVTQTPDLTHLNSYTIISWFIRPTFIRPMLEDFRRPRCL